MLSGRASEWQKEGGHRLAFEKLIVGNVGYVVRLAGRVAHRGGYRGAWQFAVQVDGLKAAISWELDNRLTYNQEVYSAEVYQRATSASLEEIESAPWHVTGRLVVPLLRALGSDALSDWAELRP